MGASRFGITARSTAAWAGQWVAACLALAMWFFLLGPYFYIAMPFVALSVLAAAFLGAWLALRGVALLPGQPSRGEIARSAALGWGAGLLAGGLFARLVHLASPSPQWAAVLVPGGVVVSLAGSLIGTSAAFAPRQRPVFKHISDDEANLAPPLRYLVRLWRGKQPLAVTYWLWGVVVLWTAPFLLCLFAPLLVLFVPYSVLMTVAVWRSAGNYRGPVVWATLARLTFIPPVLSVYVFFGANALIRFGQILGLLD